MNKDRAQLMAERITSLSISLFDIALQSSNIIAALHAIQENIKEAADITTEIVKELPPEVRESLRVTKAGDGMLPNDAEGFVDWVRKILRGGN